MTSKIADLSIIIPCFNERKNIRPMFEKLKQIVENSPYFLEIIIIDGGSLDGSQQELIEVFKFLNKENFKLILKNKTSGYGGDILEALSNATANILSWTHADLQTDPQDLITAYEILKKNNFNDKIMVKGHRKNRQFSQFIFTFFMQIIVYIFLKKYINDINAQPKLFSRNFYNKFLQENPPQDFSLDLFILYFAKIKNVKIIEFPVYFAKRIYENPKGGGGFKTRIKLIIRTLKYIHKISSSKKYVIKK